MYLVVQRVGSLSYTTGGQFCQVVERGRSVSYTPREGVCPVVSVGGEFLLHVQCLNPSRRSADGECLLHDPVLNTVSLFW